VANTVFRDGNVTVTLDDGLTRLARAAIDNVLPGVLATMEREVAQLADLAAEDWPVVSGVSRAGLQVTTTIDVGKSQVKVGVRNDVPYAIFVRPKAWHGASTAWARLVQKPMGVLHLELVEVLGPQIIEAVRRAA
jgi:hypothetical protein